MPDVSVMGRNFFTARVGLFAALPLQLRDELAIEIAHGVQFDLLPVQHVAQFLQGTLEVRHLELERVEPIGHAGFAARARRSSMMSPASASSFSCAISRHGSA